MICHGSRIHEGAERSMSRKCSMSLDEGADHDTGMFGPMITWSATQKPVLMDVKWAETSANASAVAEVINDVRENFGSTLNLRLNRQAFRYLNVDGVSYNLCGYDDLKRFYRGLHVLISPLHITTNGLNDGVDKCKSPLCIAMVEAMKNAPKLFSKSYSKRNSFAAYMHSQKEEVLLCDPLIQELFQSMELIEFCDLYDIPTSDGQIFSDLCIFDPDDVAEINLQLQKDYNIDYMALHVNVIKERYETLKQ
eukprot:58274_1